MEKVFRFVLQKGGYAVCCGLVIRSLFPTMGSALSEVLCALVAAHFEILLEEHREQFIAEGFLPAECESVWDFIHGLGHVDDLLLQCTCLCVKFLHLIQGKFLPKGIGYDLKGASPLMKFLNGILIYSGDGVDVVPYNVNTRFALGQASTQAVARIAPYLEGQGWTRDRVREYFRQRMAVHRQILNTNDMKSREAVQAADRATVAELAGLGYPLEWMHQIMCALPPEKNDPAANGLRAQIRSELRERKEAEQLREQEKKREQKNKGTKREQQSVEQNPEMTPPSPSAEMMSSPPDWERVVMAAPGNR